MGLFADLAHVREARARMVLARHELRIPATALLDRGRRYPLTAVGSAAGAGFVLGQFNVHPLRVPGVSVLLDGGLNSAISMGMHLIAELGAAGLAQARENHTAPAAAARPDDPNRGKPD